MTDQIKKYPENYIEEEKTGLRCPMCGAEVNEGQIFCIECGADLRKAAQNAETELNDVYGGPEYFEKPVRKTRMERVYAGPEAYRKPDPSPMEGVYAGPEAYRKPNEESMQMAYAGPEYFNRSGSSMGPVYAGPDIMSGVYAGPVNQNGIPVNEEQKEGPAKKEELKKKIEEPEMKVLYAAPAPKMSLAQKLKGILKK